MSTSEHELDSVQTHPVEHQTEDEFGGEEVTEEEEIVVHQETIYTVLRPAFAEFLASAIFVFIACGAAVGTADFKNPGPTAIVIALSFGFTIFVLAFTFGHISGAHINSVVSISFAVVKKITWLRCGMYCLAHFFGMLVGVGFLRWVTPEASFQKNCMAANFVHAGIDSGQAFLAEMILTFVLMLTVCAATDANKSNGTLVPYAIGLCITVCHLIALPLTGCSINPTRSFASAAVASRGAGCGYVWDHHWVFWFGPVVGGVLGTLLYEYVFHDGGKKFENLLSMYRVRPFDFSR